MNKPRYQLFVLLVVLLFSPVATRADSGDRVVPELERNHWVYTSVAEDPLARCFDEALWKAIGNVADIEEGLPGNLKTIELEIRSDHQLVTPLRLVFTRQALRWLQEGVITPEQFLRDHVLFI
ncbi:MAG: hypothetical protein JSU61_03755 [Fidelibacterota bacterium]|nr:MAG: hypothetical protein JSU61_03755 [Candidatus Neomarinimicrobiota bacterium]